jgi:hypothetical protein
VQPVVKREIGRVVKAQGFEAVGVKEHGSIDASALGNVITEGFEIKIVRPEHTEALVVFIDDVGGDCSAVDLGGQFESDGAQFGASGGESVAGAGVVDQDCDFYGFAGFEGPSGERISREMAPSTW